MIFKKLTLKNFMSYSNAEIDFSGIHVACLSGVNGAGKSSILDAITWTLWEEGRARTDELIKLGKDEMACELEFFLEGELYRAYRSRVKAFKSSQGKSNLEFQIFNSKDKTWTSLSMSAVRQTQELIIKTIKMDYGTFVNSVYLRQGKADEFTIKKPNERKQILADILGLEVYDKLCDLSKEKIRTIEQSLSLEQNLISNFEEKILKEEEIKSAISCIRASLLEQETKTKKVKELLGLKEKELNEKKEKEKQITALNKSRESQIALLSTLEEQLKAIKTKEKKHVELLENKSQIQKEYTDFTVLKERLEKLELNRDTYDTLLIESNKLEIELKEKIKQTEQELAICKSKLNDRTSSKDELVLKLKNENKFFTDFKPKSITKIKELNLLRDSMQSIENEGQNLKQEKAILELELANILKLEIEIKNKINTLSSHKHSEPCPLCKSQIADKEAVLHSYNSELKQCQTQKNDILSKLELKESEIQKKRNEYAAIKSQIAEIKIIIDSLVKELSEIRQEKIDLKLVQPFDEVKALSFLESQIEISTETFQKTKAQVLVIESEINNYTSTHDSLKKLLDSGTLVKEISEKLSSIKEKIKTLNYNQKDHDELKKNIKEKENIVLVYSSMIQAESEIISLRSEIENLTKKIKSGQDEIQGLVDLIEENKKQIGNISTLSNEVSILKKEELEIAHTLEGVRKEVIIKETMLEEINTLKKSISEKRTKITELLNDRKYYEILEKSFSKNGIQVAIIETIVPEIEKEANKILNRLTENQMHIALKTQREKKSASGLVETLDVVIADAVGSRSYELYSGGEAFKVNFSLRLALSRLLANRVSAKLQTLIIDEGFGSQDISGRERLIEVIRSIEKEFELILVVTHLDELKEAFPVQIQISKDDEGSKIKMVA